MGGWFFDQGIAQDEPEAIQITLGKATERVGRRVDHRPGLLYMASEVSSHVILSAAKNLCA